MLSRIPERLRIKFIFVVCSTKQHGLTVMRVPVSSQTLRAVKTASPGPEHKHLFYRSDYPFSHIDPPIHPDDDSLVAYTSLETLRKTYRGTLVKKILSATQRLNRLRADLEEFDAICKKGIDGDILA